MRVIYMAADGDSFYGNEAGFYFFMWQVVYRSRHTGDGNGIGERYYNRGYGPNYGEVTGRGSSERQEYIR